MNTTTTITASHSDAAFYRERKAMLVFPVIILPFLIALFWILGGGKGERHLANQELAAKPGAGGFNASVPNAKGGNISGREMENAGYGKAKGGQILSRFTNTRPDSISRGLKALAISNPVPATRPIGVPDHASSLAATPTVTPAEVRQSRTAAVAATRPSRVKGSKTYQYQPPGRGYYTASATDQQLDAQLKQYQAARPQPAVPVSVGASRDEGIAKSSNEASVKPAAVQVSDQLTASRLSEPLGPDNAFNTAPTSGSRRFAERAVLSQNNSYGSRKTIAWMIPVVVHEDQAIQEGQQVKLRLLKEITADGITIPANTILYAVCQSADDRLRLTVRSLQLGGQLIPLDLDVYDTDGSPGINVPGLSQSSQLGGQLRSSAIQGIQVPGVGGLGNAVINTARMGASQSVRQTTIRLRAGYNLFLKAP